MSTMQSVVVQHHQAARAHDGADLAEGLVVDRRVGQLRRERSRPTARRSARP